MHEGGSVVTVLFFPDYSDANPYQSNLAREIATLDESVEMGAQFGLFPILRSYRSHDDVSAIHFHWLGPYIVAEGKPTTIVRVLMTLFELLLIKASGTAVVWTCHDVRTHESRYPRIEYVSKRFLVRSGLCDRVFVHGEAVADDLIETYDLPDLVRKRIVAIEHGHYIDNYENGSTETTARAELGIDTPGTVFLFFGQVRAYKGVFKLVEAFSAAARPDSRLLVVGNPRNEQIENDLREAIRSDDRIGAHLEYVPDDRVHLYMNAANAVVLPFERITTSGSAILAMSFGKALVVPRLGFAPDLLDEEGAVMYDPDEPNALTNAISTAESRDLPAMGEHNYRLAQGYDWRTVAERTVATYRDAGS